MKCLLILALATLANAVPSARDACTGCDENIGKLDAFLMSDKAIAAQEEAIKMGVCDQMGPSDKKDCIDAVDKYGMKVAKLIYGSSDLVKDLCGAICMASVNYNIFSNDLNCADCQKLMNMVGDELGTSEAVTEVVQLLSGDSFCMDKTSFPSEDEQAECKKYIGMYGPPVVEAWGLVLKETTEGLCKAVFAVC